MRQYPTSDGETWFTLMARYNRWMNEKLFAAAAGLDAQALSQDRGAYFGSILGTLNHLVTGDLIWMKRFAEHEALRQSLRPALKDMPTPTRLDQACFQDLDALWRCRQRLDEAILDFGCTVGALPPSAVLDYANLKGVPNRRNLQALAIHFFNHQTHHRGQATTLLLQAGVDPGVTDLLMLLPELDPKG